MAAFGGLQLAYVGIFLVVLALAGSHNLVTAPIQHLEGWLALIGMAAFCYLLYWANIKPWLIQRRSDQRGR
jgi:hypothetical protein